MNIHQFIKMLRFGVLNRKYQQFVFAIKFSKFAKVLNEILVRINSHLKRFDQVFMHDHRIESKLDFSKPINFIIHGWMSGVLDANLHARGKVPDESEGM